LLDEPFAGINPCSEPQSSTICTRFCAKGTPFSYRSRDCASSCPECDLVYVLAEGLLISSGDTQTVRNDAKCLKPISVLSTASNPQGRKKVRTSFSRQPPPPRCPCEFAHGAESVRIAWRFRKPAIFGPTRRPLIFRGLDLWREQGPMRPRRTGPAGRDRIRVY